MARRASGDARGESDGSDRDGGEGGAKAIEHWYGDDIATRLARIDAVIEQAFEALVGKSEDELAN